MRKGLILHLVTLLLVSLLFSASSNIVSVAACDVWPDHEEAQGRMNVVESLIELFYDISNLPNKAFKNPANATYQRNLLRYNVDAVMHYVMIGSYESAIDKLENYIKQRIEEWILDPWKTDLIKEVEENIELIIGLSRDLKPPTIVEVSRYPETPEYYEDVTIKANVTDEKCTGVKSVILSYSVDLVDWVNVTMNLIEGLYVAEIPHLPYDTTVNYKIYAYDWAGNLAISETHSYVVIDSYPPTISHIESIPALPNYNETVTVYANVTEPPNASGVKLVILSYWNVSAWVNVTMTEGGLYTAVIPALPYGTLVQYRVSACDYAGNWATSDDYSYNVTDKYPPLARIDKPAQGSYLSGDISIVVFAYDENFLSAELIINGTLFSYIRYWLSMDNGTQVLYWNTTACADGNYTITLRVFDKALNVGQDVVTVTLDKTSPLAVINAPKDASYLKGTVLVDVTGTDDNFDKMELYIGGVLKQTWTAGGSYSYQWNTLDYNDGSYMIRLVVYDKAGNTVDKTVTVTVDNTVPTASIIAPLGGSFLKGTVSVDFSGEDNNFDKMELYIDGVLVGTLKVRGVNTHTWDTSVISDKTYKITLKVLDKAGNLATAEITVTVDNTLPTAEITKPAGEAYLRGTYDVTVQGQDENFDRMELYINTNLVKTWTSGGTKVYAWDTTTFDDGPSTIRLVVYDRAGNTVDKTVTVTVDNTPPSIGTPSWDPEEPSADEGVEVSVTVTETLSGLKNVTLWYRTDGEWLSVEMALGEEKWTATIPGQDSGVVVKFNIEAYDNAGNGAKTETYEYTVKAPTGFPLALIGAIGLVIAALTSTLLYALYRRRKKSRLQP